DMIRMMRCPVKTICTSLAASMGSIIYLAADRENRLMLPNARLMIHDPAYGGNHDIAHRKPHEIQSDLDELNKCREKLLSIIVERTGKTRRQIAKLTKTDSYFDVDEAVKLGLTNGPADYSDLFGALN
ncbi:MAG: ATP-dependent Clp protease proteolytic subunit, partial [Lachnospiraceae bacterium]|nr:ATP-dependent Clp protease proteolytic subunit [Lachnospiraceae bacterium]